MLREEETESVLKQSAEENVSKEGRKGNEK
jgi:hypothetical protein